MQRISTLLFILVLAFALPVVAQEGPPEEVVIINVDTLVYEAADSTSRVVLRVQAGQRYVVLSETADWVEIQLPRGTGFVVSKVVRKEDAAPPIAGISDEEPERVTVVDEYADVKAGPGDAYLGVRRVFRGDTFIVVTRSEDRLWVQLQIDGDLGWVKADQLMASAEVGPKALPSRELVVPIVEDRSIEPGQVGRADEVPQAGGTDGELHLELRLDATFQQVTQQFTSDAPVDNRLSQYTLSTTAYGPGLGGRLWLYDYLGLDLDYGLRFGAPIVIGLDGEDVELASTQQQVAAHVLGRYILADGLRPTWLGLSVGFMLHSFFIQEIRIDGVPSPVFVTNTYNGLRLGLEGAVALGPAEVFFGGWYILGFVDQGDYLTGEIGDSTMYAAEAGVDLALTDEFGWYVKGSLESYVFNFTGAGARHPDISVAQNLDYFLGATTGVSWRPF